jgi:hypothetical protein
MIEEAEYKVTVKLTNLITFSPIERSTPLSKFDAIANAEGTVSDEIWKALEDEGWAIEFEAEKI